jgi:hypothetical protein
MIVVDWFRSHVGPRQRSWSAFSAPRALGVGVGSLVVLSLAVAQVAAANLPNGRAYEMVSPPDKNGQDVIVQSASFGVVEQGSSMTGDAVVYASESAFEGNPANTLAPQYLSVRTPLSWSTVGLAPPVAPTLQSHPPGVLQLREDHSLAVVRSNAVLAPGGWGSDAIGFGQAFYLRDRSSDSYQTITPEPFPGGAGGPFGPTPYFSHFIGADADLAHVLFETSAELTADAVPLDDFGPKLYKWSNGVLTLESVLPDGTAVTGSAGGASAFDELIQNGISDDGSRVFFTAIGGADDGGLFVREDGTTTSIAPAAQFRGATPDGDHVFFTTDGLRRYDVETGTTTLLSVDNEPDDGTQTFSEGVLGFSDDGSRAYFAAPSQLVDGAPTTGGVPRLYLWENGVVKFIAGTGSGTPSTAWGTVRASATQSRYVGPDGEGLLLRSSDQFTGYDNSNPDCSDGACEEIFLYDASDSTPVSPDLVCVSCDPSGAPPTREARALAAGPRHLSDGAGRAFFDSPDALVPGDSNGRYDAYMWENGELHLISTGRSPAQSLFFDATPSGDDVFFLTRERLVGWDQDDARDIYDARVGGGLPEPPPTPVPCSDDPCQGPPSGRPALADPGSSSLRGLGDLSPGARASFTVRRLSGAQRSKLARGERVTLRVRLNQAGRVSVTARARMGERTGVVASGSKRARRAGTVRVPLRLSEAARRALARQGRMRVRVAVRFSKVREAKTLTLNLRRAAVRAGGRDR